MKTLLLALSLLTTPLLMSLGDEISEVRFSTEHYFAESPEGTAALVLERNGHPDGTAMVNFNTQDGDAVSGVDYLPQSDYLFFSGETKKSIVVSTFQASGIECRTFLVRLEVADPTTTRLGYPNVAFVHVQPCNLYQFTAPRYTFKEDEGTVNIQVERLGSTDYPSEIDFFTINGTAEVGKDHLLTNGILRFAKGETTQTIALTLLDNVTRDGNRWFEVGVPSFPLQDWRTISGTRVTICDDESGDICIPDPNLDAHVRVTLGNVYKELTSEANSHLTELNASNGAHGIFGPIRTLEGLETASNLLSLRLRGRARSCSYCATGHTLLPETDLSALKSLTNLTELDLSLNGLPQVTLPASPGHLVSLDLSGSQLRDGVSLNGFSSLTSLNLGGATYFVEGEMGGDLYPYYNQIEDLSFLTTLPSLTTLILSNNNLASIPFPPGLAGIHNLDLSRNQLTELASVGHLSGLTALDLSHNPISESMKLSFLSGLTNLTTLRLDNTPLTDWTVPPKLAQLQHLSLRGSRLKSLALPAGLTHLTTLELGENALGESSELELPGDLESLTTLDLANNHLTHFTPPPGLNHLTTLRLSGNSITNLSSLAGIPSLTTLILNDNPISDLGFLSQLTNLTTLGLSGCGISRLELSPGLRKLTVLDLSGNQLTEASTLTNLTQLTTLRLDFNPISQVAFLKDLRHLKSLDLAGCGLTQFTLPTDMRSVTNLGLSYNSLSEFTLPEDLTHLSSLLLVANQLTTFSIPRQLSKLTWLALTGNALTELSLPTGLTNLLVLEFDHNQLGSLIVPKGLVRVERLDASFNSLTRLVLPPDINPANRLYVQANPLIEFAYPETFRSIPGGVGLLPYPLLPRLLEPHQTDDGGFELTLSGPPGRYSLFRSTDLKTWTHWRNLTNELGRVAIKDVKPQPVSQAFYGGTEEF